ncbi:MAG: formyltetrahydrofolate deformylase [Pseudomonadota bacterium]|uniref:formyltetrahydrofolate deformylase n=1 Tax=unclassified Phenylobacterium TaxID=2640670 RepID=UPI0009EA4149|nr:MULTISPECIES: formyltetrahydrofolate deformylase [unclassified Phenylobacterium]MBT9470583.1 formyltetrahydrofolate deformylase [Phenylobacterium sp.]
MNVTTIRPAFLTSEPGKVEVEDYVLNISCPNAAGIVAEVSQLLFSYGGNILDANQFDDIITGRFFMRVVFSMPTGRLPLLQSDFGPTAERFGMTWGVRRQSEPLRVMLMASKFVHCLADLLSRWRSGELPMQVVGLISNHPREVYADLDLTGIPFHHLPVTKDNKPEQEAKIEQLVAQTSADVIVLARYMQVLSDRLVQTLTGRCINIHHSFLPGFKGAKPYHQAYVRGVKLIGATAHYVTADLDEGPIIEQEVERISHKDTPDDLIRKGRDIERRVLARALGFHLEGRVFLNEQKTVVFRD